MAGRRNRESFAERRARKAEVDDPNLVLDAALRFLEARQRSIAEVRRRLTTAGYREDLVSGAIDRLSELGMLDDDAFAASWVESRDRARPRGERALRAELAQRGVDRAVIQVALAGRGERPVDERPIDDPAGSANDLNAERSSPDESAAERLLLKRGAALMRIADPRERRQRAYALLARNGFDPGTASEVARRWTQLLANHPDDGDSDLESGA